MYHLLRPLALLAFLTAPFLVSAADTPEKPKAPAIKADIAKKIDAALPDKAPAKPKSERKILVFSKTAGFRHGSIPVGAYAITEMGKKTGAYSVVHTEDDSWFEPEKLKQFDAVFMLNTTGEVFAKRPAKGEKFDKETQEKYRDREEKLKQSLVEFVKSGKGLIGVHSATDTYQRWGAYNDMMGGAFVSHPWNANDKVSIKNLGPDHPLNAAFEGKDFDITDEIYMFRDDTALAKDRRYLLTLDPKMESLKTKGKRKDNTYPISWVSTYGKGKTFYCSLGHRDDIYWNPQVLKHYLAGIQYALGDLEADATPVSK